MASERILDFSTVCRACLSECDTGVKLPLNDVNILVKFAICTSVPVNPNDDLPCQICIDCWAKCRSWHEFHSMCQENQRILKNAKNKTRTNDYIEIKPTDTTEDMIQDPLSEEIEKKTTEEDFNFCSVGAMDEETVDSDPFDDEWSSTLQPSCSMDIFSGSSRVTSESQSRYHRYYDKFIQWQRENNLNEGEINEDQLLSHFIYLMEEKEAKPSTLAAIHSMLKAVILQKHEIDLNQFSRLSNFIRERVSGYVPQKLNSRYLTKENIRTFLETAPDEENLDLKVLLILTLAGELRPRDLHEIKLKDLIYIQQLNEIEVKIRRTDRSFRVMNTATLPYVDIVKKYNAIACAINNRKNFMLSYKKGKCIKCPMGINYIICAFKTIATKLGLDNPEKYMGKSTIASLKAQLPKRSSTSVLTLL